MRLLDPSDPMVSRSDDDDLHRQAIDAAIHDDAPACDHCGAEADMFVEGQYVCDECDDALSTRHLGTGLRSVRRARGAR